MPFNVYRDGTLLANGVTETTYTDSTVSSGTAYVYEVSEVNASGEESSKASLSVSTPEAPPAQPVNLRAVSVTASSVAIAWN